MLKGYTYRLYPTDAQRELMAKTFGCCRWLYNLSLETKKSVYEWEKKSLSAFDLCYQLKELKEAYPWLKEVGSQALQIAIKNMEKAYKGFFNDGKGYPKFKKKSNRQSFTCPHEPLRIDFEKGLLTIATIPNIPIIIDREFEGQIRSVTIVKTPTDKYYASILVKNSTELPDKAPVAADTAIGIVLGIKDILTLSDGTKIGNPKWVRSDERRLEILQRRVARKENVKIENEKEEIKIVASKNKKKAQKKVALYHEKLRNQRKDYLHKISHRITRDNQTVIVEDLNIAGMSKRAKPKQGEAGTYMKNNAAAKSGLNKSLLDAGLGMLVSMLEYKCAWRGKNFIMIGRYEPSSKMCSNCKSLNTALTLAVRSWTCASCGITHDRDTNAAINIKKIGLSQYCKNNSGVPQPVEPVNLPDIGREEAGKFPILS